jgi:hypothetical protein
MCEGGLEEGEREVVVAGVLTGAMGERERK